MLSSRGSSHPRDQSGVSCTGRQILYPLAPPGKLKKYYSLEQKRKKAQIPRSFNHRSSPSDMEPTPPGNWPSQCWRRVISRVKRPCLSAGSLHGSLLPKPILKAVILRPPSGPVVRTLCFNAGGLGLIPGQGTRSCMLQLRPGRAKYILFKNNKNKKAVSKRIHKVWSPLWFSTSFLQPE